MNQCRQIGQSSRQNTHWAIQYGYWLPAQIQNFSIILTELVLALATLVKDCAPLIHRAKLHRVEIKLGVPAFGTRLVDSSVLHLRVVIPCVLIHPRSLLLLARSSDLLLLADQALEARLERTRVARNRSLTALWRLQYAPAHRTERPRRHSSNLGSHFVRNFRRSGASSMSHM